MSKNGFDFKELEQFRDNLLAMKEDAPKIIEELLIGEGVYAVRQAQNIAKKEKMYDTGAYIANFHAGNKAMQMGESRNEYDGAPPRKKGNFYEIDFYNNLDYAGHLEKGFRSHFVPAKHLSGYYRSKFPNGMWVGPRPKKKGEIAYQEGKWVLKRAIKRTQTTQNARLTRKWERKVREYVENKGGGNNDG